MFPRGRGAGPVINVQACCTKNVSIHILGPDGGLVAEPVPVEVYPGYYTAQWDWRSASGWAVPGEIPVGAYTVSVTTGCDQGEGRATFYVIFDPVEVGGPARFSFNKTAVWFGSGSNADRAILYHLHPNDARVFSWAITTVAGTADAVKAAEALSQAVSKRFIYSISVSYTDVIDLLEHAGPAQCADEACCLVALLRAIGIPAHPATADADWEGGSMNWSFDTWTEFLASRNGSTEWLILHPHEYPGDPAATRQTFGTTKGVATNSTDDLIIMANENWVWNEAADGAVDVTFTRNACGQPVQQITAKPWVDHICEQGYWAQPHWDCTGVSPHALHVPGGFRLERSALRFGGEIAGAVTVENRGDARVTEGVTVDLIVHRPEIMGLAEESVETGRRQPLEPGERVTVPFLLRLPRAIEPGAELYLRARSGAHTLLLQPLRLPAALESALHLPREVTVGEEFHIAAAVRNVGRDTVHGVSLMLKLPYALRAHRSLRPRAGRIPPGGEEAARLVARIESLPAGGEQTLEWTARALASLEAGTVRLEVRSDDGGPSLSLSPIRVAAPAPMGLVSGVVLRRHHG